MINLHLLIPQLFSVRRNLNTVSDYIDFLIYGTHGYRRKILSIRVNSFHTFLHWRHIHAPYNSRDRVFCSRRHKIQDYTMSVNLFVKSINVVQESRNGQGNVCYDCVFRKKTTTSIDLASLSLSLSIEYKSYKGYTSITWAAIV